ncbi:MAG: F0F1 ATP synthase subunit B [Candidatus Saccharibacteria bacterium]|jgi:F-type H+-transporting ATPase subunit b|nr:MAG: F0F1 ATP synthase subunit B [Candidatus Saccharibacteria bacterium]
MNTILTIMASSEAAAEESNLFTALGIDWKLLILQTVAFLILLWFLSKFVFPPLTRMLEKRDADIEAGVQAAQAAEKKADAAKTEVEKLLKEARREASEIVSTAKEEAAAAVSLADTKAKERAERTIADAKDQIDKEVLSARKALHNETIELVAQATEKVVGKAVSSQVDEKVIAAAVREAK